jgi:hypothetical protein
MYGCKVGNQCHILLANYELVYPIGFSDDLCLLRNLSCMRNACCPLSRGRLLLPVNWLVIASRAAVGMLCLSSVCLSAVPGMGSAVAHHRDR